MGLLLLTTRKLPIFRSYSLKSCRVWVLQRSLPCCSRKSWLRARAAGRGHSCSGTAWTPCVCRSPWASLARPSSPQTQLAQRPLGGNESLWQALGCSCQGAEITVFWRSTSRALMVLIDTFSPRASRAGEDIPTVPFFFFFQEHNRNIQEAT